MTKREINKKSKLLILEIQKNPHKSITAQNAQTFCGDNFVEIIKHSKYEDWIENSNQGYQLTSKGYKFHPTKALVKKYWGYLALFAAIMIGLVSFFNGGIDLFNKSKKFTTEDSEPKHKPELVLNTTPLIFKLKDLSLKEFKKDSIFIKSIGPGKIILDSLAISKVNFTDNDYLLRDDRINLEPRIELITYHFEQKGLTESMNSDVVSIDLKFDMIPNVQPNNWFENNKLNIATITYRIYFTHEGGLKSKEISNSIILELNEL